MLASLCTSQQRWSAMLVIAALLTPLPGCSGRPQVSGPGAPESSSVNGEAGSGTAGAFDERYVVSMMQSEQSNAADITMVEIQTMVTDAVALAGGLDFIHDGMTVVLKPNLVTHLADCWSGTALLPAFVNGVTTDWRVTRAVADLVRSRNPAGKILVMEGSNRNTNAAFAALEYTYDNFQASVDEFVAMEGSGCSSRSSDGLVQRPGASGTSYWLSQRYIEADIVISIGVLKTHMHAGITGCVKNVGVGATPNAMYSISTDDTDCSRNTTESSFTSYIEHSMSGLGAFVSDFYSVRPVDFAVMDGLQGLQNGPCSPDAQDRMNMRLILASRNAIALDTVEAAVMNCSATKVEYLTRLEALNLGTTDLDRISIIGNRKLDDVRTTFVSGAAGVCE